MFFKCSGRLFHKIDCDHIEYSPIPSSIIVGHLWKLWEGRGIGVKPPDSRTRGPGFDP